MTFSLVARGADDWLGWDDDEERHVPGAIDPVVLTELREAVPGA